MVGKTVGHYRILEELGRGGMGEVYLAEDTLLQRRVALKFLSSGASTEEARQRFLREARAASALEHPNICTVHDLGEADDGRAYIVMAFCEGETLQQMLAVGRLDCVQALDIAIQISRGLAKAHAAGIVHRDIKPGNVIVAPDGVARMVDFGLASMINATRLTLTGGSMGTVAYMSPEQVRGEQVDHRTDLWSLGVLLFEILTGERAFPGMNPASVMHAILTTRPELPTAVRDDLPKALQGLLYDLLQKNASKRLESAEEVADTLEGIRGSPRAGAAPLERLGKAPTAIPSALLRDPRSPRTGCGGLRSGLHPLWELHAAVCRSGTSTTHTGRD